MQNNLKFLLKIGFSLLLLSFMSCKSVKENSKTEIPLHLKWSERMALTLMKKYPEAYQLDDAKEPKWDYVHGLVMTGFEELLKKTNKQEYYNLKLIQ